MFENNFAHRRSVSELPRATRINESTAEAEAEAAEASLSVSDSMSLGQPMSASSPSSELFSPSSHVLLSSRLSISSPSLNSHSPLPPPLPSPVTRLASAISQVDLFPDSDSSSSHHASGLDLLFDRPLVSSHLPPRSASKRPLAAVQNWNSANAFSSSYSPGGAASPVPRSAFSGGFASPISSSSRQLKFSPGKSAGSPASASNASAAALAQPLNRSHSHTQSSFRSIASDNILPPSAEFARSFTPISSIGSHRSLVFNNSSKNSANRHSNATQINSTASRSSSAFESAAFVSISPTPQPMDQSGSCEISRSSPIDSELSADDEFNELQSESDTEAQDEDNFESSHLVPEFVNQTGKSDNPNSVISSFHSSDSHEDTSFLPPPMRRAVSDWNAANFGRPVPVIQGINQMVSFADFHNPPSASSSSLSFSKSARNKISRGSRGQQHPYPSDFRSSTPKPRINNHRLVSSNSSSSPAESETIYHKPKLDLVAAESVIPGCNTISCDTMAELLRNPAKQRELFDRVCIIDCRYPYEYTGGHIQGAVNYYNFSDLHRDFLQNPQTITGGNCHRTCLIFHCEFSQKRGPDSYRSLRTADRNIHGVAGFPNLFYAEIYAIQGGYKEFYRKFPELCEPNQYVPMTDARFLDEEKKFSTLIKAGKAESMAMKANSKSIDRSHSLVDLRAHRLQRSTSTASSPKNVHSSLTRCVSPQNSLFNIGVRSFSTGPPAFNSAIYSTSACASVTASPSLTPRDSRNSDRIDEENEEN